MGNDGGSIPDRRDLVKNKPKAESADKANQTKAKWLFCALSKKPLAAPIVSCDLGKLYNRDAILEYLIDKSTYGDGDIICGHIRSLKDVKTLTLSPNTAPSSSSSEDRVQFACPYTMKEMNGTQPFVYLKTCGCVSSLSGLKEMTSSSSSTPPNDDGTPTKQLDICPQCSAKYDKSTDLVTINPGEDEALEMKFAMDRRRAAEPPKKSKKRKHGDSETAPSKKLKSSAPGPLTNPNISAASRAVKDGLAAEEAKRKKGMSDAVKSLYSGKEGGEKVKETFMTRGTFNRVSFCLLF
ncbi:DUF602-domain-containing protein [Flagelloscypha sp. PMI_526]|nr:DUF602-domain-containing protein [Flagelloscypha sp. PMI_526]